jgi:hypothetical protein
MTNHQWLCLGGPIHGQFREPGLELLVPNPAAHVVEYASARGRRTVAIPASPALYRPTLVALPGWRVKLPVWCEDRIARAVTGLAHGSLLPGNIQGERQVGDPACRWCYGRPMEGQATCSRAACITNWYAVMSLDTTTWRGEPR